MKNDVYTLEEMKELNIITDHYQMITVPEIVTAQLEMKAECRQIHAACFLLLYGRTENHHSRILVARLCGDVRDPYRHCFAPDLYSRKERTICLKKCRAGVSGIGGIFLASIVFGRPTPLLG